MRHNVAIRAVIIRITLLGVLHSARAQIVENRKGEANPSAVLFRATLFGAGTGLLLGGAVALVNDDPHTRNWDIIRWGVAGGAFAGFVIGLVYVVTRPEPLGSQIASERPRTRSGHLQIPQVELLPRGDRLGREREEVRLGLLRARF